VDLYIIQLAPEPRIIVTDHGEVVAELRAPDAQQGKQPTGRDGLLLAARVVRPRSARRLALVDWPSPNDLSLPPGTAATLFDEDLGDP